MCVFWSSGVINAFSNLSSNCIYVSEIASVVHKIAETTLLRIHYLHEKIRYPRNRWCSLWYSSVEPSLFETRVRFRIIVLRPNEKFSGIIDVSTVFYENRLKKTPNRREQPVGLRRRSVSGGTSCGRRTNTPEYWGSLIEIDWPTSSSCRSSVSYGSNLAGGNTSMGFKIHQRLDARTTYVYTHIYVYIPYVCRYTWHATTTESMRFISYSL